MPAPPSTGLLEAVERLRTALAGLSLPLDAAGAADARRERAALCDQLSDYLLPRLRSLDAPLLVVVGGSTGAGKSTLVNSLVGTEVSTSGVLRPTTRAPVLACNPADLRWFADDRILPGLSRTTGDAPDARSLRLVPVAAVPAGLALLDAPDIDSVVTANRELAGQLLAAADLWLFVTTAARYADAVPWELLRDAAARSTALAVVLDRTASEAAPEVARHLREMLSSRGLSGVPLLSVPETPLIAGALPAAAVAEVRQWVDGLAADAGRRAGLIARTLDGALDSLAGRGARLAAAADEQVAAGSRLAAVVASAYEHAVADVEESVRGGSLLRGEVLARWQEYVGTGEFMRNLESRVGQLRDRLWAVVRGRRPEGSDVRRSVEDSIEDVVVAAADRAAERVARSWAADPAGARVLGAAERELARSGAGLRPRLGEEVRAWQAEVLRLVSDEGADKRVMARAASLGVNGAGLTVMLAVFAHTGGLTGGEVAVAGGTSLAAQRVLEAVFGDEAVRRLAARARVDLMQRVRGVLAVEAARFTDRLPAGGDVDGSALRAALAEVAAARGGRGP